jgi:thioredoxin-related protein
MRNIVVVICSFLLFFSGTNITNEANWMNIEKAMLATKSQPKKILIDVYTDWCGWCKKMDQTIFVETEVVAELEKNFYSVKFDAEQKDTLVFGGHKFSNPSPSTPRSKHEFASALLQGQMSFPSYVFLDEQGKGITIVKGYQTKEVFLKYLKYISSNSYKTMSPEQYIQANP